MADETRFVTVLKTADARFVDLVVATLDAEGIPHQHPGKNHAALLPELNYIEVDLRVPEAHLADALALVERLREPDATSTRIAFRVRRSYRALGGILGTILGIVWINVDFGSASELTRTGVLLSSIGAGYVAGWVIRRDSCSLPGCRAKLSSGAVRCAKCGAEVRGVISSARKHFAALEKIS